MVDAMSLKAAVERAGLAMPELAQELNAADAKLGDGDTGGMLERVLQRMASVEVASGDDLGRVLGSYAQASLAATGSSLGTLFATGLLACAKIGRGRTELSPSDVAPMLEQARDAMLKRGQSALGDKTVIDSVDAVSKAVAGKDEWAAIASAAIAGAAEALSDFRDRPCRIGRARMFGDKSRGLDDPGMLAIARLTAIIVAR